MQTFGPYPKKILNRCTPGQEHIQPISGVECQGMRYSAVRPEFLNTKKPEVHCRKELQNQGWQHYLQRVQRDPRRNHQHYQNYHKSPLSRAKSRRNCDKMDAYMRTLKFRCSTYASALSPTIQGRDLHIAVYHHFWQKTDVQSQHGKFQKGRALLRMPK